MNGTGVFRARLQCQALASNHHQFCHRPAIAARRVNWFAGAIGLLEGSSIANKDLDRQRVIDEVAAVVRVVVIGLGATACILGARQ
jgi:hypothetical protein